MAVILLRILLLVIYFQILVKKYHSDPGKFYEEYGLDPQIIDNMPSIPADSKHCTKNTGVLCNVCLDEIQEGDLIFILKCDGRHYFHEKCIKKWLKVRVTCPLCKSNDVF